MLAKMIPFSSYSSVSSIVITYVKQIDKKTPLLQRTLLHDSYGERGRESDYSTTYFIGKGINPLYEYSRNQSKYYHLICP